MVTTQNGVGTPDPVIVVYNNAIFAVSSAQAYFNWKATDDGAIPEELRLPFSEAADEASQELVLLSAQLDAYNRNSPQADIAPPDQTTIAQSKQLLQQLQQLDLTVAAQASVNAIITQILQLIGSL